MSRPYRPALVAVGALALAAGCGGRTPGTPSLVEGVPLAPRGHVEIALGDDGSPRPVFVPGEGGQPGLCAVAPAGADTSTWEARLWLDGARADRASRFRPPDARLGATLCFDLESPAPPDPGEHRLCAEIRDRFDGRTVLSRCLAISVTPPSDQRRALLAELREWIGRRGTASAAELADGLEDLRARAEAAGFPLLALRARLIAAWVLRRAGEPDAVARAAALLSGEPAWFAHPAAAGAAAQLAYERAALALDGEGHLERAWRELLEAENGFRTVADPRTLAVAMKQAEILARVGAGREARDRLRAAIADCSALVREPRLIASAENTLAWLLLTDPDAGEGEFAEVARILERSLAIPEAGIDPLERANEYLNLAWLHARRGGDPSEALAQARARIERARAAQPARAASLAGWSRLVEAIVALRGGDAARALEVCRRLAGQAGEPRLVARGWSCAARAWRMLGDLDAAADAAERALVYHENAGPGALLGQAIALAPGQRADDFYRAARIAAERGDSATAWEVLRRLDALLAAERSRQGCAGEPLREFERERRELLLELMALETPASGARRRQREPIRRTLLRRLQEIARREAPCVASAIATRDSGAGVRAVALEDEVLLFERDRAGRVALARRTPLERREVARITRAIEERLGGEDRADGDWRALVAPLARALVPPPERIGPVTRFALHGVLQGVPVDALPVPAGTAGGAADWLGARTAVVYYAAGAPAMPPADATRRETRPVFVVDPSGDLAGARALVPFYRRSFPGAVLLERGAATRSALARALETARWLHVDAHAWYDPAFAELSSLRLADGPLSVGELARLVRRLELANLSACGTGRWPPTADSGRYGLAGALARRGVPYVIGSRADVSDDLARDFNRAFYTALASGDDVPAAWSAAMRAVRAAHPVTRWAVLMLVGGGMPSRDD